MKPKTPTRSRPTPIPAQVEDDEDASQGLDTGPAPTAYDDLDASLDLADFASEHIVPPDAE